MQGTNWLEEKSTILKSIKAKEERLKDYEKVSNAINMLNMVNIFKASSSADSQKSFNRLN